MRSALPHDESQIHKVRFLPDAVASGFLFLCDGNFAPEVYRVLGWHEGSVEESPQSTSPTTF